MNDKRTTELMFDAAVRIEHVIYIPGAVADIEATPKVFSDEFCKNLPQRADAPLYSLLQEMAQFADGEDWPDPHEVAFALLRSPGFLVQAATPCRDKDGSFSWGHYWTEWLYAPAEADISRVALGWAASKLEPQS